MMEDENNSPPTEKLKSMELKRGDLNLKDIFLGLPLGQLYGFCGAIVGLLAMAFMLGQWLNGRAVTDKEQDLKKLTKENKRLQTKESYLAAHIRFLTNQGQLAAEDLFLEVLLKLSHNGDSEFQKENGYKIYQVTKNDGSLGCVIQFLDEPTNEISIPSGVKGRVFALLHQTLQ
jgi:hypothetical protein